MQEEFIQPALPLGLVVPVPSLDGRGLSRAREASAAKALRAVGLGEDNAGLAQMAGVLEALAKAGRGAEARTQLDTLLPRLKEGTPLHSEALALQKTL